MNPIRSYHWPGSEFARIPMNIYHDPDLYQLEQERIFRGPVWCFVGLETEIPNRGDFRTTYLGDTPVLYNRGHDDGCHVMDDRCAHRSAKVRRELYGNARAHECIYHRWNYDLTGSLIGVPFQNGVRGEGGMPNSFNRESHGLRRLRVASLAGAIFASFSDEAPPLEDYLGSMIVDHLNRTLHGPIKILGYQRQYIRGNWKLYAENTCDLYHGSLLHEFQRTFGLSRVTTRGGTKSDGSFKHLSTTQSSALIPRERQWKHISLPTFKRIG